MKLKMIAIAIRHGLCAILIPCTLVTLYSFITPAHAETSDNHTAEKKAGKPTINSLSIMNWNNKLEKDPNFDLDLLASQLPLIFKEEAAKNDYFDAMFALGEIDTHIHAREIEHFAYALIDHAVNAAKRDDWVRSLLALEIAVEVSLLPIDLIPPKEVKFLGEIPTPGSELVVFTWQPAMRTARELRAAILKILPLTDKKSLLEPIQEDLESIRLDIANLFKKLEDSKGSLEQSQFDESMKLLLQEEMTLLKPTIRQARTNFYIDTSKKEIERERSDTRRWRCRIICSSYCR